jgi:hypothetical protein
MAHLAGIDGLRSLANRTGLEFETVAALGITDNLSMLFGPNGKLRDGVELKAWSRPGGSVLQSSSAA